MNREGKSISWCPEEQQVATSRGYPHLKIHWIENCVAANSLPGPSQWPSCSVTDVAQEGGTGKNLVRNMNCWALLKSISSELYGEATQWMRVPYFLPANSTTEIVLTSASCFSKPQFFNSKMGTLLESSHSCILTRIFKIPSHVVFFHSETTRYTKASNLYQPADVYLGNFK